MTFSKDPEEHFSAFADCVRQTEGIWLKLKLPKCKFLKEETKYLGFIISENGLKPDIDEADVITTLSGTRYCERGQG